MRNKEFIVLSIPSIYKNNYIISLGNKIKECNPNAFVTIGGNEMEILKKVRKTEEYKYVENLFFGNKTR